MNVNYRYLDDELGTCSTTPTPRRSSSTRPRRRVGARPRRLPKLKLLVEVDDDGTHLDGAARYEDRRRARPAPRIERREDDMYMLYTGGTTGMPKGVM